MTTISNNPKHLSFVDGDPSDAIQEVRDALAKSVPPALEIWNRIALDQRTQNGLREQDLKDIADKIEQKDAIRRNIAFFENDDYRHAATADQVKAADRDRKKLDRLIRQIQELQTKRYPGTILSRIEQWAAKSSHLTFRPRIEKIPTDLDKIAAQLAKVREAITDFQNNRGETESAAVTIAEAKAQGHAYLDALFKRGKPGVGGLYRVRKNSAGQSVQGRINFPLAADSTEHHPVVDVLALFAWLNRDALTGEIDKLIEAQAPKQSVALAKRPAMIAEIDAAISELEYEEAALIDALERAGRKVERRHNMSVLAALGIEEVPGEPACKAKKADHTLIQKGMDRPILSSRS